MEFQVLMDVTENMEKMVSISELAYTDMVLIHCASSFYFRNDWSNWTTRCHWTTRRERQISLKYLNPYISKKSQIEKCFDIDQTCFVLFTFPLTVFLTFDYRENRYFLCWYEKDILMYYMV
jgi:hypothetical protein